MPNSALICTKDHTLHLTYKNSLCRISDLIRLASSNPPIDGLMKTMVAQTLMPFSVQACAVLIRDNAHFAIQGKFGLTDSQSNVLTKLRLDSDHPIAMAMQTTSHVYVEKIEGLGDIFSTEESMLLLPIVQKAEIFGVLLLVFQKRSGINDIDEVFFSIISNIVTQACLDQLMNSRNMSSNAISGKNAQTASGQGFDQSAELFLSDLGLTRRQHEIAVMIANGVTNREIARKMAFSEATIRYETIKLYERLRVRNRSHAAARIRELKIA